MVFVGDRSKLPFPRSYITSTGEQACHQADILDKTEEDMLDSFNTHYKFGSDLSSASGATAAGSVRVDKERGSSPHLYVNRRLPFENF